MGTYPGGPVVKTLRFTAGVGVWSLVGELGSCMHALWCKQKKKKKKEKKEKYRVGENLNNKYNQ